MDNSKAKRFIELLNKCSNQQESDSERKEFSDLLLDPDTQKQVDSEVLKLFVNPKKTLSLSEDKKEIILNNIFAKDLPTGRVKRFRKWNWAAAAILLAAFSIPLMLQLDKRQSIRYYLTEAIQSAIPTVEKQQRKTAEERTATTLQLENGKKLNINEIPMGQEVLLGALKLIRTDSNKVLFHDVSDINDQVSHLQTISTPIGQICSIKLPDGSDVTLNSSSRITFSSSMRLQRNVQLDGEAYFDVKTDSTRKFIVRSAANSSGKIKGQEVTVFGTQFNVNTYANSERYECALIEGSVQVSNTVSRILLTPGLRSHINSRDFTKQEADLSSVLAWKNNQFYFNGLPIEEVMLQLSNWYGIDVHYEKRPDNLKIWGQLSRDKKLEELLKVLERTNDIKFKIKGKEVYVNG